MGNKGARIAEEVGTVVAPGVTHAVRAVNHACIGKKPPEDAAAEAVLALAIPDPVHRAMQVAKVGAVKLADSRGRHITEDGIAALGARAVLAVAVCGHELARNYALRALGNVLVAEDLRHEFLLVTVEGGVWITSVLEFEGDIRTTYWHSEAQAKDAGRAVSFVAPGSAIRTMRSRSIPGGVTVAALLRVITAQEPVYNIAGRNCQHYARAVYDHL